MLAFNEYFSIIDHTSILTEHNDFIPKPIKQLRDSTLKSSMENVIMKNISIENNDISKEYNLIRRDPKKPPMKQLLKTM
ncbi:unnamed protein product, partial [Schistosoma intercalatum]